MYVWGEEKMGRGDILWSEKKSPKKVAVLGGGEAKGARGEERWARYTCYVRAHTLVCAITAT